MSDNDREEWINNDSALYKWWKSARIGIRWFIRAHRAEIDAYIRARMNGRRGTA